MAEQRNIRRIRFPNEANISNQNSQPESPQLQRQNKQKDNSHHNTQESDDVKVLSEELKRYRNLNSSSNNGAFAKKENTRISLVLYNPLYLIETMIKNCKSDLVILKNDVVILVSVYLTCGTKISKVYTMIHEALLPIVLPIIRRHQVTDGPARYNPQAITLDRISCAFPRISAILLYKNIGKCSDNLHGLPRSMATLSAASLIPTNYSNLKNAWTDWAFNFFRLLTYRVPDNKMRSEFRVNYCNLFSENEKFQILKELNINEDLKVESTIKDDATTDNYEESDNDEEWKEIPKSRKHQEKKTESTEKSHEEHILTHIPHFTRDDEIGKEIDTYAKKLGFRTFEKPKIEITFSYFDPARLLSHLQRMEPNRSYLERDMVVLIKLYLMSGPKLNKVLKNNEFLPGLVQSLVKHYQICDGPAKSPEDVTLDLISYASPQTTAALKFKGVGSMIGELGNLPRALSTPSGISIIPKKYVKLTESWRAWATSFIETMTRNLPYEKRRYSYRFWINQSLSERGKEEILRELGIRELN